MHLFMSIENSKWVDRKPSQRVSEGHTKKASRRRSTKERDATAGSATPSSGALPPLNDILTGRGFFKKAQNTSPQGLALRGSPSNGRERGRDPERRTEGIVNHRSVSPTVRKLEEEESPRKPRERTLSEDGTDATSPNAHQRQRQDDYPIASNPAAHESAEATAAARRSYEKMSAEYASMLRTVRDKETDWPARGRETPPPREQREELPQLRPDSAGAATKGPTDSSLPPITKRNKVNSSSALQDAERIDTEPLTPPPKPTFVADSVLVSAPPLKHRRVALDPAIDGDESDAYFTAPEVSDVEGAPRKGKSSRIRVCVRKRPLSEFEAGDEDCVSVSRPGVHIGAMKQRVDLSEYTESHDYAFDDAFDAHEINEVVYGRCCKELISCVFEGGSASCFAYGQTGSGKTHTMIGTGTDVGLYVLAARDIFARVGPSHRVFVSLYEIYCNSLFDLLNHRAVVVVREDAKRRVNVCGLTWHEIANVRDLVRVIEHGTDQRRTGSTSANEFSSRSHAVLTLTLRDESQPKFLGALNVVDLAGSERAADTAANDKQTRLEGAEINKSLLALKECIRGLDERKKHIPFRGSKLTEVLRDSFVGNSRTVMIATISPSIINLEHTLNTLRYAFRVKGLSLDFCEPSKERNAPRPVQQQPPRSMSVEPPSKQKRRKSREKGRHSTKRGSGGTSAREYGKTPRENSNAGSDESSAAVAALEAKMKEEVQDLRGEVQKLLDSKAQDDAKIARLQEMNEQLMRKMDDLQRMISYHDPTCAPSSPKT